MLVLICNVPFGMRYCYLLIFSCIWLWFGVGVGFGFASVMAIVSVTVVVRVIGIRSVTVSGVVSAIDIVNCRLLNASC